MLLISSLEHGGAERQVVHLANELDPDHFDICVCSLSSNVPLAQGLHDRERKLRIVAKTWRFDIGLVGRVARLMRDLRIEVAHAFLFDAEMVARLAAKLARVPIVISSERNSNYRRPLLHSLCQRLTVSCFDAMIANSHAGKSFNMRTLGIPHHRIHVVHNGVDVRRFRPQDATAVRHELGIAADQPLVGMVASFKPQKNHLMFLRMARRVLDRFPQTRFLCVGEKLRADGSGARVLRSGAWVHRRSSEYHRRISTAIDDLGLRDHCLLLGNRDDMVGLYNACDLTVLTSRHEGTPNVLLESMACGVPVVATDVSDNAHIVPDGSASFLVPLDDIDEMTAKVCGLLGDPHCLHVAGQAARTWVEREFSLAALARKTSAIYDGLLLKAKRENRP